MFVTTTMSVLFPSQRIHLKLIVADGRSNTWRKSRSTYPDGLMSCWSCGNTRENTWIQSNLEKAAKVFVRVGWASLDWRSGWESIAVARKPWSQAKRAFTWMYSTGLTMPVLRPEAEEWILATQSRYLIKVKSYSAVTSLFEAQQRVSLISMRADDKNVLDEVLAEKVYQRHDELALISILIRHIPFRNFVCSESSLSSSREATTDPS